MNFLDSFLNRITMYRLVLYGLCVLVAYSFALSIVGILSYGATNLAVSLAILLAMCWVSNYVFAKLFSAATNVESVWITALILFLTLAPPASTTEVVTVALAGVLAMASKYFLAIRKKHLFNPAGISLLIVSIAGTGMASWWVGSPVLLPVVVVVGLLLVRKIRRFDVFWSFVGASAAVALLTTLVQQLSITETISSLVLSGPLVFFSTVMLTEPLTMPPSRWLRVVYGIIIGALFTLQFHLGPLYATPQVALIVGNVYAYLVSSRQKLLLRLESIERLSAHVYEFIFRPDQKLAFVAGQYLEWTLPHGHPDSRGNRRYFTVASSPTESAIRLGVRIDEHPSSFKKALVSMPEGGELTASSLAGDFTLPADATQKLVFIAGGVGITPFASMIRYLLDTIDRRDIILFYAASSEKDFAYRELIEEAVRILGIRSIYITNERITREMLQSHIPDILKRNYYLSGPEAMVKTYKSLLVGLDIPRRSIHTDYFPGF
jgi:ferredoxin-NADP reductase/Na+-transporting NADH:ubiquinone oxidoreductase subunit NqrB